MLTGNNIPPLRFGSLALAVLVFSCTMAQDDPKQPSGKGKSTPAIKDSKGVINKSTPFPMVTKCELDKITPMFDQRVSSSASGQPPLARPVFKFTLQSLRDLLDAQRASGVPSPLMLVHYGLDGHGAMTYGIAFTNATGADDKFTVPENFYVPDANHKLVEFIGVLPWMETFGKEYTSRGKVYIKRTEAGAFEAFDSTKHTRYVVFRTSKVLDFLQDNTPSATGTSLVADTIEIVSYAHLKKPGEYHHGIALVPWAGTIPMVDDIPTRVRFAMRALDLGSPCPQNCDLFEEEYTGMPVPGCPERVMLK